MNTEPLTDEELAKIRESVAVHLARGNYVHPMTHDLRRLLSEVDRLRAEAAFETREEWAIRVENPEGTWWYHHESTGEDPQNDLATVLEVLADGRDMAGQPIEHGPVSIVKRTVHETAWETVTEPIDSPDQGAPIEPGNSTDQ